MADNYNTKSSGRSKKKCSHLVVKVPIKPHLDKPMPSSKCTPAQHQCDGNRTQTAAEPRDTPYKCKEHLPGSDLSRSWEKLN